MSSTIVLQLQRLAKAHPGRHGPVIALREVSFQVLSGEFVAIVGASGSGKSALLNLIAGLEQPTSGQLVTETGPIAGPGSDRALVFGRDCLFPWLTLLENVEFSSDLERHRTLRDDRLRQRASALLFQVGLEGFVASYPRQLSQALRQRAAIARALLHQPRILLLDDPFGALDADEREPMQELLLRLCQTHAASVLFATHDAEEAVFLADRVLVMAGRPGHVVCEIAVPFARPRHRTLKLEPEFSALRGEVSLALQHRHREAVA